MNDSNNELSLVDTFVFVTSNLKFIKHIKFRK